MPSDYTALSDSEEQIQYACSLLLKKRYISQGRLIYSGGSYLKDRNPDFTFISNNMREITERLDRVGFEVKRDPAGRWVSAFGKTDIAPRDAALNKDASAFLIACGLLYERNPSEIGDKGLLDTDIQDVLQILVTELEVYEQKPPATLISKAMTRLERAQIVARKGGSWSDDDVEFCIMPSVRSATSKEVTDAYLAAYAEKLDNEDSALNEMFAEMEGDNNGSE